MNESRLHRPSIIHSRNEFETSRLGAADPSALDLLLLLAAKSEGRGGWLRGRVVSRVSRVDWGQVEGR